MKNNLKFILAAFIVTAFFTSCEEELIIYTPESSYAQLGSSNPITMSENLSSGTQIKVLLGTADPSNGGTFNFNVTGDTSRFSVTPSNGVIEFQGGAIESMITVTPIDNSVSDGNANLKVSLTGDNIGPGGTGLSLTSVDITIVDDDCPTLIDETETWISQYQDSRADATEVELTKLGENQWYCPTTWGYNGVANFTGVAGYAGLYPFDVVITLNPADNTITVEGTSSWAVGGTGKYDPCTNTFSLAVLDDELFSGGGIDNGWTLTGQ